MKTVKTIAFVIFLSIISLSVNAVNGFFKGDTIRYKFDKMLVEVVSTNFISKSPEKTQMDGRIEQVQKILGEMSIRITSYNVCYTKLLRLFFTNYLNVVFGLTGDGTVGTTDARRQIDGHSPVMSFKFRFWI